MGELLPSFERNFDPKTTLLWGNVKFMSESEILILIPYCKTKGFEGKLIDLYPLPGDSKCPVAAISLLKRLASKLGFGNNENPVFAFKQGKNLSKESLNKILKKFDRRFLRHQPFDNRAFFPCSYPQSFGFTPRPAFNC